MPTPGPTANIASNFMSVVENEVYSNVILRRIVEAVGVIVGAMIVYYLYVVFYDVCACHTCPSLSWILGLERRGGYTLVEEVEIKSPKESNMIRNEKMMEDDEEKATKSKAADISTQAMNQFEQRFLALEKALESEKQMRIEKESELKKSYIGIGYYKKDVRFTR